VLWSPRNAFPPHLLFSMVPHRPFTVDASAPLPTVAASIQVLCKQLLPGWMGVPRSALHVSAMPSGLTNVLFKARAPPLAPHRDPTAFNTTVAPAHRLPYRHGCRRVSQGEERV
jgi:hypothetical protein